MKMSSLEKCMLIGGSHVLEAIQKYGESTMLDFLVRLHGTKNDWIINELLIAYPILVELARFAEKLPAFEVDEDTFKMLAEKQHII